VNARADDIGREVALRALELRSRSEPAPHRPRGRAAAAPEIQDRESRGLEDNETRSSKCGAEDSLSAESEGLNTAGGSKDADRLTAAAQDGNPARIERGDGRLTAKRSDDRLP